jgi:hypothetical protein
MNDFTMTLSEYINSQIRFTGSLQHRTLDGSVSRLLDICILINKRLDIIESKAFRGGETPLDEPVWPQSKEEEKFWAKAEKEASEQPRKSL